MRLIHLIELRPQIRDILIRDIISCVKYRDESFLPVVFYSDDDLFLAGQMIQRIIQIVCHYLFDLKLIRAYVDRTAVL